ncbi:MAG: potassium channel family protein [Treponema sp.]
MNVQHNFAVIGLGEFGSRICEVLVEGGASVIAFDQDPQAVERIKGIVPAAMLIDTADEYALLKAPLDDVSIAIVAIGNNIEASILTTTLLKQRNISYIAARAVSSLHETVLKRIGANEVLNIEVDSATQIAKRLISPDLYTSMEVTQDISISKITVPKLFAGKTIADIALKEHFNLKLIAVVRIELDIDREGNPLKNVLMYYPDDTLTIQSGDVLFLIGSNEQLAKFSEV